MRIYLVETKSGGKVRGSFECGEILKVDHDNFIIDTIDLYYANRQGLHESNLKKYYEAQGYTNQEYAIEIKDFRVEHMSIGEASDRCNDCSNKINCLKCHYFDNPMYLYKWDIKNNPFDEEKVTRIPQSFQYIKDPYTGEKAILLPVHKEYIDMMEKGKKKYEFRNVLPKALREALK